MSTQLLIKKINREVKGMRGEMKEIKKFLFAPLKDPEGTYRASFVQKMLVRAQEKDSFHEFTDARSFLKHAGGRK